MITDTINNMKTWKHTLYQLLMQTDLVTLSTVSESIPWSSPSYFYSDKSLNIYLLLDTNSQHMKNILFLPKAAISLEKSGSQEFSFQLLGNVEIFSPKDIQKQQAMYKKLYSLQSSDVEFINQATDIDWRVIKLSASRFFLFDPTDPSHKQELCLTADVQKLLLN